MAGSNWLEMEIPFIINGLNKIPDERVWRAIFCLLLYLCFHGSDYLTICYVCDAIETTTFVNIPPIYLGHALN